MKKLLFALLTILSVAACEARDFTAATRIDSIDREINRARAELERLDFEHYRDDVWGRGRYSTLGFVLTGNTDLKTSPRQYTRFGLFLNKGTNYLFPRGKGFGSFIKVGVDVRWVDLEIITYDSSLRSLTYGNLSGAATDTPAGPGLTYYPPRARVKTLSFIAGVVGFGPSVSIAPFSWADNSMASVKVHFYAHYQPAFGLMAWRASAADLDGESVKGYDRGPWSKRMAYVNVFDFGVRLQWSRFGFGVEGRRCSARFPSSTALLPPADPIDLTPGSPSRRTFATTRLTLSLTL